jgi:protein-tyrosine phosphatase
MSKPRILFVCGRNKWRSPTAQNIYKNDPRMEVRSAGVSGKSPHPISNSDLLWADLILIMESKYRGRIQGLFRNLRLPPIESLDIPDEYEYMDEELIDFIKSGVEHHIKLLSGD